MSYHPKPKIRLDNNQPTTLSEKFVLFFLLQYLSKKKNKYFKLNYFTLNRIIEENVDLYVQNIPNDLTKVR